MEYKQYTLFVFICVHLWLTLFSPRYNRHSPTYGGIIPIHY